MVALVFLILFVVILKPVYAQDYFDFYSQTYLVSTEGLAKINFVFDLVGYTPTNFAVRPLLKSGFAYIEGAEGVWVSSYDFWENMPELDTHKKLKLIMSEPVELSFAIQNKLTGAVYETATKTYYPRKLFSESFDNLQLSLPKRLLEEAPRTPDEPLYLKMLKYLDGVF